MSDSLISCKSIACGLLLAGLSLTSATVPAYAEDWNNNYKVGRDTKVLVGGTKEKHYEVILNKSYDNIFFGNAENTSFNTEQSNNPYEFNEAQASYNTGILAAGGSGTVIMGGCASAILSPYAHNNTIIMQSGSTLTAGSNGQKYGGYGTDPSIDGGCVYGGYATSANALARADFNTVIFKKGSSVKTEKHGSHFAIHGGAVYSANAPFVSCNKVIFEKEVNLPAREEAEVDIIGGLAIAGASEATVIENYIGLNGGTFCSLVGGFAQGYDLEAKKNNAVLTDVKAKEFKGCLLHLLTDGGKSIANNNEFTIKNGFFDSTVTGCEIKVVDFSNNSIGRSQPSKDYTISAEKNKLTLIDTTVQATVFGLDFCGYEVQPSKKTVITISGNVLTLKGGRYEGNIIGYSNSFFSKYASSENISIDIKNNTVAICKGTTMPEFSDSTIISGFSLGTQLESDGCFSRSDNTLEFHEVWGMTAGNIRNFTRACGQIQLG